MKLIINADDYGLRPSIDAAVENLFSRGVVRSVSFMPGGSSAIDAACFLAAHPALGAGLHLDLDGIFAAAGFGKDDHGRFLVPDIFFEQEGVSEEIAARIEAQFARFVELVGRAPDHLDGHHHAHLFPPVLRLVVPVMRRHGVRAIRFIRSFYAHATDAVAILDYLGRQGITVADLFVEGPVLPATHLARTAEVMVHVALPVAAEQKCRAREYAVLADEAFRDRLSAAGYECCRYSDLVPETCPDVL